MVFQNMKEVEFSPKFKSRNDISTFEMDNEERPSLSSCLDGHWKGKIELNYRVLTRIMSEFELGRQPFSLIGKV